MASSSSSSSSSGGEVLETGVQQVAGAVAMDSRDSDGIPQSQVVELIKVRVRDTSGVHFVHCQHDGLAAAQQHVGHLLVRGGEARADIRQKDDDSGVLDGDLGLIPHEGQDLVVGPGLDTAGVDKGEGPAVPVRLPIDAVPGDARGVLHNGEALSNEFVEQHGLAHIGPAHDGDDGKGHGYPRYSLRLVLGELDNLRQIIARVTGYHGHRSTCRVFDILHGHVIERHAVVVEDNARKEKELTGPSGGRRAVL